MYKFEVWIEHEIYGTGTYTVNKVFNVIDKPMHVRQYAFLNKFGNQEFQLYAGWMGFVYYLELIVWFYAVKHIDVSVASSITTPWPVITVILAITFLNESIQNYQIISLIIVVISVYGIILAGKKKRDAALLQTV